MKLLKICLLVLSTFSLAAQPLTIQWQKCLGGTNGDAGYSIKQTDDGGYLMAGITLSNDGDVSGNHLANSFDDWIVKLDSNGYLQWQKCFGGSGFDRLYSMQLVNQGFIFTGFAASGDGDVIGGHPPSGDFWVVKCDSIGGIEWQANVGGSDFDYANDMVKSFDNGYAVIGMTHSSDYDVVGRHDTILDPGASDAWLVKLDSGGTVQWTRCYGGDRNDEGYSIAQTRDSGFVFVASASSDNGDVQGLHGAVNGGGSEDYWVVKIDKLGGIEWQKCLGGFYPDVPTSIIKTFDNGYIVTGHEYSNDFDVTGHHGWTDNYDVWVVKLDSIGTIQWQKCLGGTNDDFADKIIQLADSGYLAVCVATSSDGDLSANPPLGSDIWLVKMDQTGNIQWQQCLGGSCDEEAFDIQLTSDGGAIFTGATCSNDVDVSGNHGDFDVWVVKLAPLPDAIDIIQNPITDFACHLNNATGFLNVSFYANGNEHAAIGLFDIAGRNLLQFPFKATEGLNSEKVDAGNLSSGVYLVRLSTTAGSVTKKVVVE